MKIVNGNFFEQRNNQICMLLAIGLSVASIFAAEQVLIITHHFNRPEFIEIQNKTFKKFLQDEYEFVVFNDANTNEMAQKIDEMCVQNNVRCIRIPQEIHDRPYLRRAPGEPYHRPNVRHANVLQYSIDTLGFQHEGIVAIVDSDMFLVKPFSFNQYMENYDILSVLRGAPGGIIYLWPGLACFNMRTLPGKQCVNFNCGVVRGQNLDSGGYMHYYFEKYSQARVRWVSEVQGATLFCPDRFMSMRAPQSKESEIKILRDMGFDDIQITFLQQKPDTIGFLCDHHFLHYRAGTNYDNQSQEYLNKKSELISWYLDTILKK